MANKAINVLMSLKDRFTSPMKKVGKQTKEAQKQFKLAQNTVEKFGESANDSLIGLTKTTAQFTGGLVAAGAALASVGIQQLGAKSMEAANVQLLAETKLESMLKNLYVLREQGGNAYKKAAENLKLYASELQTTGIIGDEATIAGMAQLATYQLTEKQIKTLSQGMLDLTAKEKGYEATLDDVVEAGKKLGEATQGEITALEECGIFVDETTQEWFKLASVSERVDYLSRLLTNRVGGVNKTLAETDEGKAVQAMNKYGDMTEEIGKKLLPFKSKLWSAFGDVIPKLQSVILPILDKIAKKFEKSLDGMSDKLGAFIDKIPDIIDKVGEAFSTFSDYVDRALPIVEKLLPVLIGIGTAFVTFNVITKVASMFSTLTSIIKGVSAAGGILNFVMSMNPFALVAIAIGALVTGFILLYQRSEKFREIVQLVWEKLKVFAEYVKIYATYVVEQFKLIIDFVKNVFSGNWSEAWENVKEIFANKFEMLKNIAKAPLEFITGLIDKVKDGISKIKLPAWLGGEKEEHNALGTSYFGGGSTYVNEGNRGELINLPNGSQIVPHDLAARKMSGNQNINITLNVQGNVIGNDDFYNECGRVITMRLKTALANM